jgi:hypothetical protein
MRVSSFPAVARGAEQGACRSRARCARGGGAGAGQSGRDEARAAACGRSAALGLDHQGIHGTRSPIFIPAPLRRIDVSGARHRAGLR